MGDVISKEYEHLGDIVSQLISVRTRMSVNFIVNADDTDILESGKDSEAAERVLEEIYDVPDSDTVNTNSGEPPMSVKKQMRVVWGHVSEWWNARKR